MKPQHYVCILIACLMTFSAVQRTAVAQDKRLVKVLVTTPACDQKAYGAIADVMAGSIVRELNRTGGMEIIARTASEKYLGEKIGKPYVRDRVEALDVAQALGADCVIFSTMERSYEDFKFTIRFLEAKNDIIQRSLNGHFKVSSSANEVGRLMKEATEKMVKYIPLPSELDDPGFLVRDTSINPERLPPSAEIKLPPTEKYGYVEQVMTYYRVFPGETEYEKFEQQRRITRLSTREDLDEQLTAMLNKYYIYGDFAVRHGLQAYLVKDCSYLAINLLLANNIPVFYVDGVLTGYRDLSSDGVSILRTIDGGYVDSLDMTHRKRIAIFFMVPKPGSKNGLSKKYLADALAFYIDEWSNKPRLVEIKDSMFDIISSGLE